MKFLSMPRTLRCGLKYQLNLIQQCLWFLLNKGIICFFRMRCAAGKSFRLQQSPPPKKYGALIFRIFFDCTFIDKFIILSVKLNKSIPIKYLKKNNKLVLNNINMHFYIKYLKKICKKELIYVLKYAYYID